MTLPKRSADPLQRLPTLPAVPQLLLLDRCKTSTKSRFHRNTPSLVAKTKCCVDRLRPPHLAKGALGEHRRHDTDGIRLEIEAPGCRSSPQINRADLLAGWT